MRFITYFCYLSRFLSSALFWFTWKTPDLCVSLVVVCPSTSDLPVCLLCSPHHLYFCFSGLPSSIHSTSVSCLISNISHGLPPPFTAQGVSLFLHIHHQALQVPTHLAYAMLEKQRDLFWVTQVFPAVFSSLLLANHLCLLNKLLWKPKPFGTVALSYSEWAGSLKPWCLPHEKPPRPYHTLPWLDSIC